MKICESEWLCKDQKGWEMDLQMPSEEMILPKQHLQKQQGTRMILQDWDEPRPEPHGSRASLSPSSIFSGEDDPLPNSESVGCPQEIQDATTLPFLQASLLLSHCPSGPKANSSLMHLKSVADHLPEKQQQKSFFHFSVHHSPAHCSSPTKQVSEILMTKPISH